MRTKEVTYKHNSQICSIILQMLLIIIKVGLTLCKTMGAIVVKVSQQNKLQLEMDSKCHLQM